MSVSRDGVNTSTVLEELFAALTAIDPVEEPDQYLNILDQWEREDLRVKQIARREKLQEKVNYANSLHL